MEKYCSLTLVLIGSSIKDKFAMDFLQFQHFIYSFPYLNTETCLPWFLVAYGLGLGTVQVMMARELCGNITVFSLNLGTSWK